MTNLTDCEVSNRSAERNVQIIKENGPATTDKWYTYTCRHTPKTPTEQRRPRERVVIGIFTLREHATFKPRPTTQSQERVTILICNVVCVVTAITYETIRTLSHQHEIRARQSCRHVFNIILIPTKEQWINATCLAKYVHRYL